jgi:hypothetical protein
MDVVLDRRGITFNRTPAQVINILTQNPSGKGLFFPEGALSFHQPVGPPIPCALCCDWHISTVLIGTAAHMCSVDCAGLNGKINSPKGYDQMASGDETWPHLLPKLAKQVCVLAYWCMNSLDPVNVPQLWVSHGLLASCWARYSPASQHRVVVSFAGVRQGGGHRQAAAAHHARQQPAHCARPVRPQRQRPARPHHCSRCNAFLLSMNTDLSGFPMVQSLIQHFGF